MKIKTKNSFIFACLSLAVAKANAQIVTDGTMGAVQSLSGTNVTVFETLGTRTGDNLFHSFSNFNVNSGQTVTFTGDNNIQNVVSRVTGSEITSIDGILSSQIGNANFFLLNPNGVVVGADGQFDVPAAIYLSTAHKVTFSDGNQFSTDLDEASTLTIESPESFGFLSSQGNINIDGAVIDGVAQSGSLHISGANVDITDSMITIYDGQIDVHAVGEGVSTLGLADTLVEQAGNVTLNYSLLATPGVSSGGGQINIGASSIDMVDSLLEINTTSDVDAGANSGVNIRSADLSIDDSTSSLGIVTYTGIDNLTANSGNAANIDIVVSGTTTISGGASITSAAYAGSGNAGQISIKGGNIVIAGGADATFAAGIYGYADSSSIGSAGAVTIDISGDLSVGANSTIDGSTYGSGNAASIDILAGGAVTLADGGNIVSNTYGDGVAGNIHISADSLSVSGVNSSIESDSSLFLFETDPGTFVTLAEANGNAGSVVIDTTADISINDGAKISAASLANGAGGHVNLDAANISIDRSGANNFTGITTESASASGGAAGSLDLNASGAINVLAGGVVTSSSRSASEAGSISVQAGSLTLDHQAAGNDLETAITSQGVSDGNGGTIQVDVSGAVTVLSGAQIDTTTFGAGNGGDVTVNAGSMNLDGNSDPAGTGIGSQTQGSGNAGNVNVEVAGQLAIVNAAQITSDTFSSGNGGDVTVTAGSILIDGENTFEVTGISSLAEFDALVGNDVTDVTGHAGAVKVTSAGNITLTNGGEISSSTQNGATGNGGNVDVVAESITFDGWSSIAAEVSNYTGLAGRAGNVNITTSGDILIDGGQISVATNNFDGGSVDALAQQGEINITSANLKLTNYGSIRARSSADIAASNISMNVDSLVMENGEVTTSALNANGGAVVASAADLIVLRDSLITTSVFGTGNGGDITIDSPIMLMDNGFVQANTAGVGSSGGEINLQANAVVPSTGDVLVGGSERYSFNYGGSETYGDPTIQNVIQAAAPDGINGQVTINAPEVDLSAELTVVETTVLNLNDMVWDPCSAGAKGTISNQGKGGVRATPDEPGFVAIANIGPSYAFENIASDKELFAFESYASHGGCSK
jgi:filamentous hemagglutinin family protein